MAITLAELQSRFPLGLRDTDFLADGSNPLLEAFIATPDFPHLRHHSELVRWNCYLIAEALGLNSEKDLEILMAIVHYHDRGYGFYQQKILRHEDHSVGGAFFAWDMLRESPYRDEVVRAIEMHSLDVLPEDASLYAQALQGGDRVAGLGDMGFLRHAWYLGFISDSLEILLKYKLPYEKGFDEFQKATMAICLNEAIPFLVREGKDKEMLDILQNGYDQFYGKKDNIGNWIIKPIIPEAQILFLPEIEQTELFAVLLRGKSVGGTGLRVHVF